MKTNTTLIIILVAFLSLAGCKSVISLDDMQKQKSKATSELSSAKKEILELADMKEKYSLDIRKEQVKALEKRQKQLNKDIKSIKSVESTSAQKGANTMVDNLKSENAKLSAKISSLNSIKQENWSSAKDSINQEFNLLEKHIKELTSNIEELDKMEIE